MRLNEPCARVWQRKPSSTATKAVAQLLISKLISDFRRTGYKSLAEHLLTLCKDAVASAQAAELCQSRLLLNSWLDSQEIGAKPLTNIIKAHLGLDERVPADFVTIDMQASAATGVPSRRVADVSRWSDHSSMSSASTVDAACKGLQSAMHRDLFGGR